MDSSKLESVEVWRKQESTPSLSFKSHLGVLISEHKSYTGSWTLASDKTGRESR
jgi:hypothetical protein